MRMRMDGFGALMQGLNELEDAMQFGGKGYSIGTNVRYSVYQEFGTSYQSGKAHVRPGFDAVVAMHLNGIIEANDNAEAIITKLAMEIERQIKIRTPVDTGHLRNSYRAERY